MAERLLQGRPLPEKEPTQDEMTLWFRSQCAAASRLRYSVTMIVSAPDPVPYKNAKRVIEDLICPEKSSSNVPELTTSSAIMYFPVPDTTQTAPTTTQFTQPASTGIRADPLVDAREIYEKKLAMGLARDRVAVTALLLAADMDKHNVTLTAAERAECKRRPELIKTRYMEVEESFSDSLASKDPSTEHQIRRVFNASISKEPFNQGTLGRQTPTLRMTMFTCSRAECMLHCHSDIAAATDFGDLLQGLGQSDEVRKNYDDRIGREIFFQFHFASPDHVLLNVCQSEDGAVDTTDDPKLEGNKRNIFLRRFPAAVTVHDRDGNPLSFREDGVILGPVAPPTPTKNVLYVTDAAKLMYDLHAKVDYQWALKNLR